MLARTQIGEIFLSFKKEKLKNLFNFFYFFSISISTDTEILADTDKEANNFHSLDSIRVNTLYLYLATDLKVISKFGDGVKLVSSTA
jgi:hypothetical protein